MSSHQQTLKPGKGFLGPALDSFLLKSDGEFLPLFSSFVQYRDHNGNSKLTFAFLCINTSDPQNKHVRKVYICLFIYTFVEDPLFSIFDPFLT